MTESGIDWPSVWRGVAVRLGEHRAAGRARLMTEDTVRFSTVLALAELGVGPDRLTIEVPTPALAGGKLDLVVDGLDGTVVELKYPRGSRTGISPDTMTLGEMVRDFLRVAVVEAGDRWVVQVVEPRLARYLRDVSTRHDLHWRMSVGEEFVLVREALEDLPKTARDAIGTVSWLLPVHAVCEVAEAVDDDLALYAYRVRAPHPGSQLAPLPTPPVSAGPPPPVRRAPAASGGARGAILEAITGICARSGKSEVTLQQVVDEMRRNGSAYAESTVRTMVTSHMCAQVQGPGIAPHADLDRVDRGTYRLRTAPF